MRTHDSCTVAISEERNTDCSAFPDSLPEIYTANRETGKQSFPPEVIIFPCFLNYFRLYGKAKGQCWHLHGICFPPYPVIAPDSPQHVLSEKGRCSLYRLSNTALP